MTAPDRPDNGQDEGRARALAAWCRQRGGRPHRDARQAFTAGYDAASARAGAGEQQRERVAAVLARHQHLMGRRNDDEPQWFSWCACGWDGGPVEASRGAPADVRAAYRLHVADELLALLDGPQRDGVAEYATALHAFGSPEYLAELAKLSAPPCPSRSHGADGWHCAVEGPHGDGDHANAAGTVTW